MLTEIEKKLRQIVQEMTNTSDEIDLEKPLTDFGISSANFVRFVIAIETEFDFEFDDELLNIEKLPNLHNIAQYISDTLKKE